MKGDTTMRHEAVALAREASRAGNLYVSAISAWEIAMLTARGWIVLTQELLDWVRLTASSPPPRGASAACSSHGTGSCSTTPRRGTWR